MTIVVTNDDGIDAPGLHALERALDEEPVVVAPRQALSGCSHRVTTHGQPIHVEHRGERRFAVDGTPADCVRLAIHDLVEAPTLVISGINPGGNLGADVYPSGTVAAAREAAFLGIPGIAISHYVKKDLRLDWDQATRWARVVLQKLRDKNTESGTYWNVNFPHLPEDADDPAMVECDLCKRPLPVAYEIDGEHYHYKGVYSDRERDPGADVDLCFSGNITVTLLHI